MPTPSSDTDIRPSMSEMYREEDEESESEEGAPLEVRTRRPSWSAVNNDEHRRAPSTASSESA